MPPFRRLLKTSRQSRDLGWGLVYAVYILMSIGLIISSAIILKYGDDFFTSPGTNPESTSTTGGTTQRRDDDSSNGSSTSGGAALSVQTRTRNALIHSGVVSSIGVASGVVSFVLNLVSFGVQRWLDALSLAKPMESIYPHKAFVAFIICIINTVAVGGNIALAYGFAHTAHTLRLYATSTGATTPAYLGGASAMAGLTAFMALLTVIVDYAKVKSAEREYDLHTGEQQRSFGGPKPAGSTEAAGEGKEA